MAHAINNPLTALAGTLELILEDTSDCDPRLERALRLAGRIRDVVDRTLRLHRQGQLRRAPEDIGKILRDLRGELAGRASRAGVELILEANRGIPRIETDRPLLVAALVSIAENSLDAMPSGGRLSIQARYLDDADHVSFRIADTGPGVPTQLRGKMFEPFFTTKPSGTGLGLAIAHGVVLGHGGRIEVEDAPCGASFLVEIPRTCADAAPRRHGAQGRPSELAAGDAHPAG